jgi:hypothetical protein
MYRRNSDASSGEMLWPRLLAKYARAVTSNGDDMRAGLEIPQFDFKKLTAKLVDRIVFSQASLISSVFKLPTTLNLHWFEAIDTAVLR